MIKGVVATSSTGSVGGVGGGLILPLSGVPRGRKMTAFLPQKALFILRSASKALFAYDHSHHFIH